MVSKRMKRKIFSCIIVFIIMVAAYTFSISLFPGGDSNSIDRLRLAISLAPPYIAITITLCLQILSAIDRYIPIFIIGLEGAHEAISVIITIHNTTPLPIRLCRLSCEGFDQIYFDESEEYEINQNKSYTKKMIVEQIHESGVRQYNDSRKLDVTLFYQMGSVGIKCHNERIDNPLLELAVL